ncbi:CHAP domain-containing protein [Lactococcus garvieae]|uniref:CHAP domain-containing protein n=1 Tax=Lactococcus garvieae TaxID=1363 RepID=A0AA46TVB2_9LACT|nr:CHAP domain-containing protein [Lactococcus garvieae]UYT10221.1 CHAP domain-containing protein [Lactococcus garvieae]UYT12251.1 CHAP domain-containing protein [Lactococcus garvieae]
MKKKLITALMLSTVILSSGASLGAVKADSTDDQIAKQDAAINAAKGSSAEAQAKVDAIQSQVNSLQSKKTSTANEVNKLMKEQKEQSAEIARLHKDIKERNTALEAQARSAQTSGSATDYMSTILDSKSLTDAIQKMTAMATVSGANKAMLEKQQEDEKAIQAKLKDNEAKYAKATKLQQELEAQSNELASQEAALKVAQLNYQTTIANSESKKQSLIDQKAAAVAAQEAAAKQAAAVEAQQAKAEQAAQAAQKAQAEQAAASKSENKSTASTETVPVVTAPVVETAPAASAPAASTPAVEESKPASNNNTTTTNTGSNSNTSTGSNNTNNSNNTNDNNASGGSGSTSTPGSSLSNPYPWGQCTWGVWEYFGGSIPTYAGNAGDWVVYANSGPAVGTIAVFPPGNQGAGGVGHVAVVTAVNGNKLTVSETNFSGPNGGGLGIRTTREVSAAGVSFIRP